jgi:Cu-processing system ATP-binding protein
LNRGEVAITGSIAELRRKAALPVRIRVKADTAQTALNDARPDDVQFRKLNGRMVELTCQPERKLDVIRWITASGCSIDDLDVELPDLDQIYAHFRSLAEEGR